MSTIHAVVHPQDDLHFVGTLGFTGGLLEEASLSRPPLYETLTPPSIEDLELAFPAVMDYFTAPKPRVKWSELLTACEKSRTDLQALSDNLKLAWFKEYVLKEEKEHIQQAIDAGLAKVQAIYVATEAINKEGTPVNLRALKHALRDLQHFQPASSSFSPSHQKTPLQAEPTSWWLEKIKEYLVPIALMSWGLIVQSSLLAPNAINLLLIMGAFISIVLKAKENYQNFMQEAKTEDIKKLIEIRDALMENVMNTSGIDNLFQGRVHTEALRKFEVDQSNRIGKLEREIIQLKEGQNRIIDLLLNKQSSAHSSSDHKEAGNPASVI